MDVRAYFSTVTPDQLMRDLIGAVGDRESFVYAPADSGRSCEYRSTLNMDGETSSSCIIGELLTFRGATEWDLRQCGYSGAEELACDGHPVVRAMLACAQHCQDNGTSWGAALRCAERVKACFRTVTI